MADKTEDLGRIAPIVAPMGVIFIPAALITSSAIGAQASFTTVTGATTGGAFTTFINSRGGYLPVFEINVREVIEGYEDTHQGFGRGLASAIKSFFTKGDDKKSGGKKKIVKTPKDKSVKAEPNPIADVSEQD